MAPRIYLANVGANSSHPYSSPLFDDGSFELLPIPERPAATGPHSVPLGGLASWNQRGESLRRWIPERLWDVPAHFDPEFDSLTYGDNCERAPRAAMLRRVVPGDFIFFIARLEPWPSHTGTFEGRGLSAGAGFFLVGFLEVAAILPSVRARPPAHALERFGANAHVRKGLNDPRQWDGFWVFAGSSSSRRFSRAVPVDRSFVESVLATASGEPWRWNGSRSDLQTIGSYTRTCRCIIDPASPDSTRRIEALRRRIEDFNPGDDGWQPRGPGS